MFVSTADAGAMLGVSKSTVERLIREGDLPKPKLISGRRVGLLVSELETWAINRPASDLPPPPNTGAPKPRRCKSPQADRPGA